jgi:hypothetical protein
MPNPLGITKNMKVYHFLTEQYCLQALLDQRLKVSTLDDLNDPFELLSFDFSDNKLRPIFRNLKKRLSQRLTIICFSMNWHEPLLWSHYGDRHKGCALEFDISGYELVKVDYQKNRVKITSKNVLQQNLQGLETKLVSTKYEGWEYEKEARLFLENKNLTKSQNLFFYDFSGDFKPLSIIAGPLSTLNESTIENNLPKGKSIQLITSRLAFRSFRVVKNKNIKNITVKGNA